MHINLLSCIIYFLFKKNRFKNIIVILFLLSYLTITNYSASLIRSIIFFILMIINNKYDLNISSKNLLFFTITIFIIINPFIIFDYGFLYSALVTLGLIISSKYFKKNYIINLLK